MFKKASKYLVSLMIGLLLLTNQSYSQKKVIKNLFFEGAGIRGLAYTGCIKSLEEHNLTSQIENVGGTSAGAIITVLFSIGYTADEMEKVISDTRFDKFNDGKFPYLISGFLRIRKRYGWYKGEKFKKWLGFLIEQKTGNPDITFEELHNKGYKDLYFITTCLNKQKSVLLSYKTYPKMKVVDAVRASMSIPFYYQAVFVDSVGNTYKKQNKDYSYDVMIDGGIIDNFPIWIFDDIQIDEHGNKTRTANFETVGIRIDSYRQITSDMKMRELVPRNIKNFKDHLVAFYVMVIENLNRSWLTDDDWARTISVSDMGISPKVKRLSLEQKKKLYDSGKRSTDAFLDKFNPKNSGLKN